MSSSIMSCSALSFAGCLLRRSKIQRFLEFQNYKSSYRRTHMQFAGFPAVHSQTQQTSLQTKFSYRSSPQIDMYSNTCIKMRCFNSSSNAAMTEPLETTKRLVAHDSNIFHGIYVPVQSNTFSGFSMTQKVPVRFISSQRCSSKYIKVLSNRETPSLGKNLRISRRNSEKAGQKSALKETGGEAPLPENPEQEEKKLTLYQRFKKTYKEHGKVLVAVHVATSLVWFGSFYTAASLGFDIVPLLESWNLSEKVISPFRSGGLGNVALAYLLYKLATPARYTVTIAGTNFAIKYLQKEGRMKVVPKADSLRSLYKEGKEDIKGRSKKRMTIIQRKARARRKQRNSSE